MATHHLISHLGYLLFLSLAHLIIAGSNLDRSISPPHHQFFKDLRVNGQEHFHLNPCRSSGISCQKRISGDAWPMQITQIDLRSRHLDGFLSAAIGRLSELNELSLPNNFLHGQIPHQIGNCQKLEIVILGNNMLSGKIPSELSSLTGLRVLDLSSNRFSGDLSFLRNFPNLENLSLADNLFEGNIPLSLKSFRNLRFLDLSENNLHDPIQLLPELGKRVEHLGVLPRRYRLAESATKAATPALPPASSSTIRGNQNSSIAPSPSVSPQKKKRKRKLVARILGFFVGITGGAISGALFSLLYRVVLYCCRRRKKISATEIFSPLIKRAEDLEFLEKEDGTASLDVIGRGGCGEVYKTELPGSNGKMIAIKKIIQPAMDHDDLSEAHSKQLSKRMRQIRAEIQTVGHIRHRNLLPLVAHVCRPDCHYLVYEFMKNGSLQDSLTQVKGGTREMDWATRHKIAMGIAAGLEYLHMNHRPRIIHRDLKPANILLDDDMEPRIADFGLAKAMPDAFTHMTTSNLAGTVGYIAPEYHQTLQFTEKCDIYSFGVVVAALVTGKLPSDEFFQSTEEMSLVKWLKNVMVSENASTAIDPKLMGKGFEEQMLLVLKIACFCTHEDAKQRPNSKDVRCMLSQVVIQRD